VLFPPPTPRHLASSLATLDTHTFAQDAQEAVGKSRLTQIQGSPIAGSSRLSRRWKQRHQVPEPDGGAGGASSFMPSVVGETQNHLHPKFPDVWSQGKSRVE
jgi:hypothetical protein